MDFEVGGYEDTIGMVDSRKDISNCEANGCEDISDMVDNFKEIGNWVHCDLLLTITMPSHLCQKNQTNNEHKGWKRDI
jgi:hypothetical protein